ncbi:hypothetical protein B0J12DRAFT_691317 [Macrophomina phaseolina]|uniref:Secreted protein n=1 Tax=Macrophomina phaseolina TaxID=35725 RepID=A0ABQ8FQ40_9PEZI|nr:hypothetical protein B0J12DRAFT_691317 [Macrophomina phaseolina]
MEKSFFFFFLSSFLFSISPYPLLSRLPHLALLHSPWCTLHAYIRTCDKEKTGAIQSRERKNICKNNKRFASEQKGIHISPNSFLIPKMRKKKKKLCGESEAVQGP